MILKTMNRTRVRLPGPTSRGASPNAPALRFTPYAWGKLVFLRDLGPTEVGGFGVSAPDDLLLIDDVVLVHQVCSEATVRFDDAAVADFFDSQVDLGKQPEQFGRVWIHTHPGNCPWPSRTDEATFARCFGATDWAIMFVVARGGRTYGRLQFQAGPRGELVMPAQVDFSGSFPAAAPAAWEEEYRRCIEIDTGSWLLPVAQKPTDSRTKSAGAGDLGIFDPERAVESSFWPLESIHDRFF